MRILFSLALLLIINSTRAYDVNKAKEFNVFFKSFSDENVAQKMKKICPDKLLKRISLGEEFLFLDIRTEKEKNTVSVFKDNVLNITIDKVFEPENLKKIPEDKNVVVVCKSGLRATAIAMALRQSGYEKVFILNGGITKLLNEVKP